MASAKTESTEAASQVVDVVMPPTAPAHGSVNVTVHELQSELNRSQTLKTLPPKTTSPLQTNKASSSNPLLPLPNHNPNPITQNETLDCNSTFPPPKDVNVPTLVERIRRSEDKTLRRIAPVTIGANDHPRILISDSVFQKGAELHKDFIICYFNGKALPFNQIQSVLNHIEKILEKSIWYVGDSMFHTAQWSSAHSRSTPPLKVIKIWAHLTGVPIDLRHDE
ncbi:hypothetical protein DY000_02027074 [Brassica cretica]|uniref:DUF4283 domain-containing protein n=1 Tax=Brassica cretica TaxID=69181 RepID=A0ABQ7E4G6_BRACR|nr:hypothetical protein DY000_02027074 [Brassica cretica]